MIAIMVDDLPRFFAALSSDRKSFASGQLVFRRDAAVEWLHWIEHGVVHLLRYQESGGVTVLQRAESGFFLAEASLFSPRYHCDASAVSPSQLVRYPKREVIAAMRADPEFAAAWAHYLSQEVQRTRARAEILSLRRLDDRLDAWLALRDGIMPQKGGWAGVAREIGVSPEALYRSLARKRATMLRSA